MSKNVDRNQVLTTTRVCTTLKNDGSWIHTSKQEKEEQDKARMDHAVEARQKSYVLSIAKKFESVDSPTSPTQLSPSDWPQAPTEELIQNGEAQSETTVDNTAAENKEAYADTTVGHSNVEDSKKVAEVYADVHVEPAEQLVATTTAENKEEYADTTAEQTNVEHSEAKVSADGHEEDPVAETADVVGTGESKDTTDVPVVLAVELKLQEEPSIKTEPANATHLEDAGVESTVQPAEESCNKCCPDNDAKDIFEAVTLESSTDTSDVIHATPAEEAALQKSVEPVPDLSVESVSESPTRCAAETAKEGSCEGCPPEQSTEEIVEVVAKVVVESSPETPAVNNATPRDEAAVQDTVEPILDTASESPTQSAAETAVKSVDFEVESTTLTEPVLKTRAEEVIECEVQPVINTVVEQGAEPAPENAADRVMELSIEDALEPVTASEAVAVQNKLSDRAIEMTDALHVEPPAAEAVPKPVEDPKQPHSVESKLNQSDDTNTAEMFQKPREGLQSTHTLKETSDGKAVCSFCDQVIDGNVKIILSEPLVTCHPDCLKCGVCAKVLGDMLTPMFLHDQVIHCDGCFAKALEA
ncbi:zinc finger protein 185 [Xiphias gladius]|uniref:zinc finger protein 185 n=1 Tax=Xiphias gladius TaxID=8245 RepID=UPI001A98930B|nr:zinc finger protein 185 [Xiphias gladius]